MRWHRLRTVLERLAHRARRARAEGEGEKRALKLTLVKQVPTKGSLHWTNVLEPAAAAAQG